MAHALGNNFGKFYSFQSKPVLLDLSFVVDSANGNGLGVRSVKGQGVKNVYMATSASFTGTTHTGTNVIDSISGGTASLAVGMPIATTDLPAGAKIASITGTGSITSTIVATTGHAGATITYVGVGNPMVNTNVATTSEGYALIELEYNYTRNYGGSLNIVSPTTGSTVAINSTSLTVGAPYIIVSVGAATKGAVTIAPQADTAGSLASSWFLLFDGYGNTYIMWIYVTGVGGNPPIGISGIPIQVTIASGASANNITTAISAVALALSSTSAPGISLPSGVAPFTASGGGGATLTLTSTQASPAGPLPGAPQAGVISGTAWTFAATKYNTNLQNWQAVGVPPGVVPAVGVSFIATATGESTGGGSTGLVKAVGVSGIFNVETIGDPNQSIAPIPMGGSPNTGGWLLVQFLAPTQATVDAQTGTYIAPEIPTAPADNSVISMQMLLEQAARVGGNQE